MNLTYRCKHVEISDGVWVKEPLIPITLMGPTGIKLNFTAILDSGSDFVLLPLEVAEALELEYDKTKKDPAKTYVGERITTTRSKVRIRIEKGRENVTIECRCAILLNKEHQYEHIILGSTFFEHFRILFDYPNNRFQIKRPKQQVQIKR